MARVEPDDVKDILDQKSVNSAMFVRAQGKLPGEIIILFPTGDAEAVARSPWVFKIDPMEASDTVGFPLRQSIDRLIGKVLDAIEELSKVVGLSISTVKFLVVSLVEFEGKSDEIAE